MKHQRKTVSRSPRPFRKQPKRDAFETARLFWSLVTKQELGL